MGRRRNTENIPDRKKEARITDKGNTPSPSRHTLRNDLRQNENIKKGRVVRPRGLEPPLVAQLAPQASASTNSATAAACSEGTCLPEVRLDVTERFSVHKPLPARPSRNFHIICGKLCRQGICRHGRTARHGGGGCVKVPKYYGDGRRMSLHMGKKRRRHGAVRAIRTRDSCCERL